MSESRTVERVVVPEDVAFREVGGEAVILNLETEHYFTLDAVGTRMWKLLEEYGELGKVVEVLLVEYEVERRVVERDLAALVGELVGEGLLVRG
jgi:hypothetical protein